jgi:hypothetical protein
MASDYQRLQNDAAEIISTGEKGGSLWKASQRCLRVCGHNDADCPERLM